MYMYGLLAKGSNVAFIMYSCIQILFRIFTNSKLIFTSHFLCSIIFIYFSLSLCASVYCSCDMLLFLEVIFGGWLLNLLPIHLPLLQLILSIGQWIAKLWLIGSWLQLFVNTLCIEMSMFSQLVGCNICHVRTKFIHSTCTSLFHVIVVNKVRFMSLKSIIIVTLYLYLCYVYACTLLFVYQIKVMITRYCCVCSCIPELYLCERMMSREYYSFCLCKVLSVIGTSILE